MMLATVSCMAAVVHQLRRSAIHRYPVLPIRAPADMRPSATTLAPSGPMVAAAQSALVDARATGVGAMSGRPSSRELKEQWRELHPRDLVRHRRRSAFGLD